MRGDPDIGVRQISLAGLMPPALPLGIEDNTGVKVEGCGDVDVGP